MMLENEDSNNNLFFDGQDVFMKSVTIFMLALIVLACGIIPQSLYSMDVEAEFLKADRHYVKGDEPVEALKLYRAIIENGQNEHYITLSKLKTALILDTQLMQYDEAIDAYQAFLKDYPNHRLMKLVRENLESLQAIRDHGVLDDYLVFKKAEENYLNLTQKEGVGGASTKGAALVLYQYAKSDYNRIFNEDMMRITLSALVHEECYFRAQWLMSSIDRKVPAIKGVCDIYRDVVKVNAKRALIAIFSELFVGLCVIFVLFKKGYKVTFRVLKKHRILVPVVTVGIFIYLYLYYQFVVIRDLENKFDLKSLFFIYGQYLLLIPLSISLYGSFSFEKNRWLKTIVLCILSGLLGVSSWLIFAYYFDYLWLFGF